jgi:hypothetical protein
MARSRRVGDEEMSADVRWIRSYVVRDQDGRLGTFCIYEASSEAKIREHARQCVVTNQRLVPRWLA